MPKEQIAALLDKGVLCNNTECPSRISCARFYAPERAEFKGLTTFEVTSYKDSSDNCFKLRKQLQGTTENIRYTQRQRKYHKRQK